MVAFGMNVMDFGAKGDGTTDDTCAIQKAIDETAKRGGGAILFPFTKGGYRIASPAKEFYDGKPVRAQLIIPPNSGNICLMGEMPCRLLNAYIVRSENAGKHHFTPTAFGNLRSDNTRLFSDWEAPEETDPEACPWSILSAPEGTSCAGKFSTTQVSIINLEFRVKLDKEKMYPVETAVNLQNVSRVHVENAQFCLNEQIGDTYLGKELQKNPTYASGLVMSGDQNDDNVLRNTAVQGFRYGFVLGEHVVADYLYVHNCEEGITFHDASHLSVISHVVAQHNAVILSACEHNLYGMKKGVCNVSVGSVNFESGVGLKPSICQLRYGVYDPESRLHGELRWHKPWGEQVFPVLCGEAFRVEKF